MEDSDNSRVALVTGAGSGIGRATALAFARDGWDVVVSDMNEERNDETARHIQRMGHNVLAETADISRPADLERLFEDTRAAFGRLDAACNNAGIEGDQAPTADCTIDNWDRVLSVNLKGTWLCMKHEIPLMLESGGGSIVNVASVAGMVGFAGMPAYVASKHGMNGLTKTAALDYATENIRVNAVCPGAIETPMIDRFTDGEAEGREQLEAMHPVGRMGTPDEVADAIIWLCSEEASFVTGHIMPIDGGLTAR
mgnify:CR=1 FL=1